jgi:hypothetical protein
MSNPDERTAVDQFGKGDKYFGVCTLLATMPGLPMFGHGQIEGYTERYGMEYQRSYFDEYPDQWLVARHEREISPLLHRRHLFAEVRDFLLYDFYDEGGHVNEDVYAYSNQSNGERALIVFHNRYATTRGWIRMSASYVEKGAHGDKHLRQRSLGEAFGLPGDAKQYVVFRDAVTGLEYLHRSSALREKGMHMELQGYRCHVFLDWRDVRDDAARPWGALCDKLRGRGVTSLEDELRMLELEPVHAAVFALLEHAVIRQLVESATAEQTAAQDPQKRTATEDAGAKASGKNGDKSRKREAAHAKFEEAITTEVERLRKLLQETQSYVSNAPARAAGVPEMGAWRGDISNAIGTFRERLTAAARLTEVEALFSEPWSREACAVLPSCSNQKQAQERTWVMLVAWAAMEAIGTLHTPAAPEQPADRLFERLRLRHAIAQAFEPHGFEGEERWRAAALVRAAFAHAAWAPTPDAPPAPVRLSWLHDAEVAWLIGVHEHEGVRYLVREPFERLLWWMALRSLLDLAAEEAPDREKIEALERGLRARVNAAERAGYQVEVLLDGASVARESEHTPFRSR